MKVKRFMYVCKPLEAKVRHLHFGMLLEGESTACGIRLAPKWRYGPDLAPELIVCKSCLRGGRGILVHRVRGLERQRARARRAAHKAAR